MSRARFFVALIAAAALAQERSPATIDAILDDGLTVRWRDDAIGHPDLIAFRDRLMEAAREHDLSAILDAADPGFRGCGMRTIGDLRVLFQDAHPLWHEFYQSLTEGGVLSPDGKSFDSNYAVWTFPAMKTGVFGPENFKVIDRANAPVLEQPESNSKVLAHLSYSVVIPQGPFGAAAWQRVEFQRGQFGFIDSKYLIDPIGMSVRMGLRTGRWRLVGIATYCD